MRAGVKRVAYAGAGALGLNALARVVLGKRLLVVCFHGVCDERPDVPDPEGMHVPVALFEQQVRVLIQRYRPVSLADVRRHFLERAPLPPRAVLVTIDDGYRNVVRNALPVLRRYQVPSVLFPIPGAIDADRANTLDGSLMTWGQLKELRDDELVAVGSHGQSHEPLASCATAQLERELATSRKRLTEELDIEVDAIAYPYGSVSAQVVTAAREVGYKIGFTTEHKHARETDDALLIPRVLVGAYDTVPVLNARLAGWTEWLRS